MHVVPAHRTASPIALKIVATLQVAVVVQDCSFPFYLITSTPTLAIPKFFSVSWSLLLFAVSRRVLTSEGGIDQAEVRVIRFSFGGRLGFCLGRCLLHSYTRWAPVSLASRCRLHYDHASLYPVASITPLVYMSMHHPTPWQCCLHDHASSYSVFSFHPSSVRSPSRSCAFPFYQLDSNHDGPIPPLFRIRSR